MQINVAVVGSRDFPSQYLVERVIYELFKTNKNLVLVSGGARGVDRWAEQTAKHHKFEAEIYQADWAKHGKSAGFIRNNAIVRSADIVVAFHHNNSKGTKHTISLAKYFGKPCVVVKA